MPKNDTAPWEPMIRRSVYLLMRFTVRKVMEGWMVWDTTTRTVAIVDDLAAIGLSEKTAQYFADMLNSQDELREHPPRKRSTD